MAQAFDLAGVNNTVGPRPFDFAQGRHFAQFAKGERSGMVGQPPTTRTTVVQLVVQ